MAKIKSVFLMLLVLSSTLVWLNGAPTPARATSLSGLIVPIYIYPSPITPYTDLAALANAYPSVPVMAIINPSDGPGTTQDPNFVTAIADLQAAGITVLGYVFTTWGARSIIDVEADIAIYYANYTIDGILLDEMNINPGGEGYYSNITTYAHGLGYPIVVGNPGTDTVASYVGTVDTMVIYESSSALPEVSYLDGWHDSYGKSNWGWVAYDIAESDLNATYLTTAGASAAWMYATDDTGPNPWDAISSYLGSLFSMLNGTSPPPADANMSITTYASGITYHLNDNSHINVTATVKDMAGTGDIWSVSIYIADSSAYLWWAVGGGDVPPNQFGIDAGGAFWYVFPSECHRTIINSTAMNLTWSIQVSDNKDYTATTASLVSGGSGSGYLPSDVLMFTMDGGNWNFQIAPYYQDDSTIPTTIIVDGVSLVATPGVNTLLFYFPVGTPHSIQFYTVVTGGGVSYTPSAFGGYAIGKVGAWSYSNVTVSEGEMTIYALLYYVVYVVPPGPGPSTSLCNPLPPTLLLQLENACIIPAIVNTYAWVIGLEWFMGILAAVISGMIYLKSASTWLVLVVNIILAPVFAFLLPAQFSGLVYDIVIIAIAGLGYLLIRG